MLRRMIRRLRHGLTGLVLTLAAIAAPAAPPVAPAAAQTQSAGPSGLPLPRFVSLKSSRINVRRGPGQEYEIAFVYVRAGLPVEIVQEFENWRKIRDADGDEGWVFHSLLSGRRTALVAPWEGDATFPLRATADPDGRPVAYLQARVMADVLACEGTWCRLRGDGFDGWIEQERLWGVYPAEVIEP